MIKMQEKSLLLSGRQVSRHLGRTAKLDLWSKTHKFLFEPKIYDFYWTDDCTSVKIY